MALAQKVFLDIFTFEQLLHMMQHISVGFRKIEPPNHPELDNVSIATYGFGEQAIDIL